MACKIGLFAWLVLWGLLHTTVSCMLLDKQLQLDPDVMQQPLRRPETFANTTSTLMKAGVQIKHPNSTTSSGPMALSALLESGSGFITISHSVFPHYSVRIQRVEFCDPTVKVFTGYIDVGARHLFFFYFESRNDPASDDVMLWLNGGPGGSATIGLFLELGPCLINGPNGTRWNPYAWNDKTNLLFIDQPIGVGFSYADFGETVSTTEEAAIDIAAFMAIFMSSVEGLAGRPFHIAGESYGGRYVPLFAAEIYDQNARLQGTAMQPVNLSSVLIGNGYTDAYHMREGYFQMQCSGASGLGALQSISTCTRMKEALPRCQKWLKQSCLDVWDAMNCQAATSFCETELTETWLMTGRSMYDMSKGCPGEIQDTLCYPASKDIAQYLNSSSTMRTIHADIPFQGVASWEVNRAFTLSGDVLRHSFHYLEALLERGIRVLIYVGEYDFICNWVGNHEMVKNLEWTGKNEFLEGELRGWTAGPPEEEGAGLTKTAGPLTFTTIKAAGHMVPLDKPREALVMVNKWLANEAL